MLPSISSSPDTPINRIVGHLPHPSYLPVPVCPRESLHGVVVGLVRCGLSFSALRLDLGAGAEWSTLHVGAADNFQTPTEGPPSFGLNGPISDCGIPYYSCANTVGLGESCAALERLAQAPIATPMPASKRKCTQQCPCDLPPTSIVLPFRTVSFHAPGTFEPECLASPAFTELFISAAPLVNGNASPLIHAREVNIFTLHVSHTFRLKSLRPLTHCSLLARPSSKGQRLTPRPIGWARARTSCRKLPIPKLSSLRAASVFSPLRSQRHLLAFPQITRCQDGPVGFLVTPDAEVTRYPPARANDLSFQCVPAEQPPVSLATEEVFCASETHSCIIGWYQETLLSIMRQPTAETLFESITRMRNILGIFDAHGIDGKFCEALCQLLSSHAIPALSFASARDACFYIASIYPIFPQGYLRLWAPSYAVNSRGFRLLFANTSMEGNIRCLDELQPTPTSCDDSEAIPHVDIIFGDSGGHRGVVVADPLLFPCRHSPSVALPKLNARVPVPHHHDILASIANARVDAQDAPCLAEKAFSVAFKELRIGVVNTSRMFMRAFAPFADVALFGGPLSSVRECTNGLQSVSEGSILSVEGYLRNLRASLDSLHEISGVHSADISASQRGLLESLALHAQALFDLAVMGMSGMFGCAGVRFDGALLVRSSRHVLLSGGSHTVGECPDVASDPPFRWSRKSALSLKSWQFLSHNLMRSQEDGLRWKFLQEALFAYHARRHRMPSLLLLVNTSRFPLESFHPILQQLALITSGESHSQLGSASFPVMSLGGSPVHYVATASVRLAVACVSALDAGTPFVEKLLSSFGDLVIGWEVRYGIGSFFESVRPLMALEAALNTNPSAHSLVVLPHTGASRDGL